MAMISYVLHDRTDQPDDDLLRVFTYPYVSPFAGTVSQPQVEIQIRDGRYGGDIGSQTWNSAPLLSKKLCAQPLEFFQPMFSQKRLASLSSITPQTAAATPPPTRPTSPTPSSSSSSPQPFRILELGSGTGLTGLTAGLVLARLIREARERQPDISLRPVQLILTDYLKPVLENLEHNLALNAEHMRADGLDVSVELLDWRDLNNSPVKGQFDLILGTDLVYEVQHADWAANVVDHFLAAKDHQHAASTTKTAMPPTPADSRVPSPMPPLSDPFDPADRPQEPIFHLVLALRPTFRAESTAVHTVFNSRFGLPTNKDSHMPLPERKYMPSSEGPALEVHSDGGGVSAQHGYTLLTRSCDTLVGVSHGQGCGDYQYLTIVRP